MRDMWRATRWDKCITSLRLEKNVICHMGVSMCVEVFLAFLSSRECKPRERWPYCCVLNWLTNPTHPHPHTPHAHMHAHAHTYTHARMHTHEHAHTVACFKKNRKIEYFILICLNTAHLDSTHTRTHTNTHARTHAHSHRHTHTHTRTYTHTRVHIHTQAAASFQREYFSPADEWVVLQTNKSCVS